MAVWPNSPGVAHSRFLKLEDGDPANASGLTMDVHCGTHIDAPLHTLRDGAAMSAVSLDACVGTAEVVDIPDGHEVTPEMLEAAVPRGARRVLLRTQNSRGSTAREVFDPDFAALTAEAARWLVDQEVLLIGVDYMSVQRFGDASTTHDVLLRAGVVLLEGLLLEHVQPGAYELLCLPLSVPDLEAAPARAILRPVEES